MDMQRVTRGAKGGLAPSWYRTILTSAVGITQVVQSFPLCGRGRSGPSVGAIEGCYLRWRVWVLSRTSSHMWGNWELASVPVKGWITDPDIHGLFYGSSGVVCLPIHHGEVVHTNVITRGVVMVIDWDKGTQSVPWAFAKGPCRFPLCTPHYNPVHHTYIYWFYFAFLCDGVSILGGHHEVLGGVASFERELDPNLTANNIEAIVTPTAIVSMVLQHYVITLG